MGVKSRVSNREGEMYKTILIQEVQRYTPFAVPVILLGLSYYGIMLLTRWTTNRRWKQNIKQHLDELSRVEIEKRDEEIRSLKAEAGEANSLRIKIKAARAALRMEK